MARVLALIPDLLFGSRVYAALTSAGHEVELVGAAEDLQERLSQVGVLVVDLTRDDLDGPGLIAALGEAGQLAGIRTLGFYSHVEAEVKARAEAAGFDLVVPRSRMAREGAELVGRLATAES